MSTTIDLEYKSVLENEDPVAQYDLGIKYLKGTSKNYGKSFNLFKSSATKGNAFAQNKLGVMYYGGHYVDKDYEKAFGLFKKSVDQGNSDGQNNLGVLYFKGHHVVNDYSKAFELFKMSADQGNDLAKNNLGIIYFNGLSCDKDLKKAFELFKSSAVKNCKDGQFCLGYMYLGGHGVDKDYNKAFELFKSSSDTNIGSQYNLAYMYENGYGIPIDSVHALNLYMNCIERKQDHTDAIFNVALLQKKHGIFYEALKWFIRALENREGKAEEEINLLLKNMNSVTEILTKSFNNSDKFDEEIEQLESQYIELSYGPNDTFNNYLMHVNTIKNRRKRLSF